VGQVELVQAELLELGRDRRIRSGQETRPHADCARPEPEIEARRLHLVRRRRLGEPDARVGDQLPYRAVGKDALAVFRHLLAVSAWPIEAQVNVTSSERQSLVRSPSSRSDGNGASRSRRSCGGEAIDGKVGTL
jgi:hypothetical protein